MFKAFQARNNYEAFGRKRLLKLARHLTSGKLGHKRFDFTVYNEKGPVPYQLNGCGTAGCALGECPFAFPRHWHFRPLTFGIYPNLIGSKGMPSDDAEIFFGITNTEVQQLFISLTSRHPWAKSHLADEATAETVADSIRTFVAWRDQKSTFAFRVRTMFCA